MSRSSGRGPKRCPAKSRPEAACTVQRLFPALVLTSKDVVASVISHSCRYVKQLVMTGDDPELAPWSWTSLLTTGLWSCALLSDRQAMVTQRTAG